MPRVDGVTHCSDEEQLTEHLVHSLQQQRCKVVAREWYVQEGYMNHGKGDLVVKLPCGTDLVIEVRISSKHIV